MRRLFLVAAMAWPLAVSATAFRSAELSPDSAALLLETADGKTFPAPRQPEQVEFGSPQLAPDRKQVGWLALYPNCCTSYPVPLTLVVLDEGRQAHAITGMDMAIFGWCFSRDSRAVALRQGVLHGSDLAHFELRRIADGKRLAQYDYPAEAAARERARRHAPAWLRCASD